MNEKLVLVITKFERLIKSSFMSFDEISSLKNKMGVYVIYEKKTELLMAA